MDVIELPNPYPPLWYKCRRFVFEMLADRGYVVTEGSLNEPEDVFIRKFANKPCTDIIMKTVHKTTQEPVLIFFLFMSHKKKGELEYLLTTKITNEIANFVISSMESNGINHAIVVYEGQFSSIAEKTLRSTSERRIECFRRLSLMFNVTKHEWVPPHVRLTPKEKKNILGGRNLKDENLPIILRSDPVARWYGYKRGDLIKITRLSETGGSYVNYRICQ